MNSSPNEVVLGDVLRLALPLGTTLRARGGDSRRSVKWVTLLTDRTRLAQEVNAADIVIYPPVLRDSADDDAFQADIEALAQQQAAALIVFGTLNDRDVKTATAVKLPVLEVTPTANLRDTHKDIAALLLDHQSQLSTRGMELYRDLSKMSRDGLGLRPMAELMAKLTEKLVVIQDKRLEVVAIAWPSNSFPVDEQSLFAALSDQDNLPAVLRNRKAAAKSSRSHWQQLIFPNHDIARLVTPIISGDRARGYLSIIGPAGELDMLDTMVIENGAMACALEMAKAKAVSEARKSLRGNFLEGLLAGTLPKREIERLSARLDHDTAVPHSVLAIAWDDDDALSLRRIETTLNWLLSTNNRPTLVHVYGDDHICVFQTLRTNEDLGISHRLVRRLSEQLQVEYPDRYIIAGISGPAYNLNEWPEVHNEATQALEVGKRLQLRDSVEFNSLGVYRLLGQLDGIPAVHTFTDRVIGPLVEYDRRHRSNLVNTIAAYFGHHGNVSQTAEALFIHRNTLLYRLDRIQELTGHDLDQADMRLALHLALKLWQLRPEKTNEP
ncbi:MAG: helix-turn-helix domain-containing protein [Anaerolineae bacterium]|nr:helix-turn-helix domain-containing protein [Anaerolineae bacterium]